MNRKRNSQNILFVCSRNKWRSKTAETVFKDYADWNVKSAGTSKVAVKRINQDLITWADRIFVMEKKHREIIEDKYGRMKDKISILYIPDDYQYMDDELIEILKSSFSI